MNAECLGSAASGRTDHADSMRIVDEQQLSVLFRDIDQSPEVAQDRLPYYWKTPSVEDSDEAEAIVRASIRFQEPREIRNVRVFVNLPVYCVSPAQTGAIDDAGVVQPIAIDDVAIEFVAKFLIHDRSEKAFISREAGREQNAIFGSDERGNLLFEFAVDGQRSAQKAHGGYAVTEFPDTAHCRFLDAWMG